MAISVELGKNIVRFRMEKGITQEQLALSAEINVSYLRLIEHGKANPTIDVLDRLARILEVPITILLVTPSNVILTSIMLSDLMPERMPV